MAQLLQMNPLVIKYVLKKLQSAQRLPPIEFENKTIEFSQQNVKGDHAAAQFYGFTLPKWHKELEKPYPNIKTVLSTLRNREYRLGVIANQSLGTERRLEAWGLLQYFDVVVASAEAGVSKPNLAIFELALSKAGCAPCEAIMVGDRLDNDIEPANRLNMTTVWCKQGYAGYSKPTSAIEKADFTIHSIEEILDIL